MIAAAAARVKSALTPRTEPKIFSGHPALMIDTNQDEAELTWFVSLCQRMKVRRYLEIGSRNGLSFGAVMLNLPAGAYGMSVDVPENENSAANMVRTAACVRRAGSTVTQLYESSRSRIAMAAVAAASAEAPFDLVFIDGDHRYEGVKADWRDYGRFAPVIAFHDVTAPDDWMSDGHVNGVGKFWRELKKERSWLRFEEYATPGSKMGYGVVFMS